MKPLNLSFSGLNSYISRADIDFTHFFKDRIFGIFGETGAGKSTIIDAITYALFGRIDRVGNEIKTSINPKAKRLFVSFTFHTGGKVYKIIRTRTDRKTEATLYEVVGNKDIPIAEKDRDVSEKISELIGGFDYNEFTKIIALPQNKFSEFLMAKPSDRASLLEKIFGLEKYGDRLWSRLTEKEKINSLELSSIENNLEQLSHVSEEQLSIKESRLYDLEEKKNKETGLLKEKEERFSELKEFDKLQKNRASIEKEIENLRQMGPRIEKTRDRLKDAEKVAPFRRDIENMDYWQREIRRSYDLIKGYSFKLEDLQDSLTALKEEEKAFEEEKLLKEKDIAVKLKASEEALKIKEKIKETERERVTKEKNLFIVVNKLKEEFLDLENLNEDRKMLEKKRDELRAEVERITLTEAEINLFTEIGRTEKAIGTVKEIENNLSRERENIKSSVSSIEDEKKRIIKHWRRTLPDIPLNVPEKADEEIASIKKKIQIETDSIVSRIHELEIAGSAFYLAQKLEEGLPCPVCGSKTHPSPAKRTDADEIPMWKRRLDDEKERLVQVEKLEGDIKESIKTLREFVISKASSEKNVSDLEERRKGITEFIIKKTGLTIDECEKKKKQFEDRIKRQRLLSGGMEKTQRQLDEISSNIKSIELEIHNLEIDKSKMEEEIKQLKKTTSELVERIKNLIGDESPEKLRLSLLREEKALKERSQSYKRSVTEKENEIKQLSREIESERGKKDGFEKNLKETKERIERELIVLGVSEEEFRSYIMDDKTMKEMRKEIEGYEKSLKELEGRLKEIEEQVKRLKIRSSDEKTLKDAERDVIETKERIEGLNKEIGALNTEIKNIRENMERKDALILQKSEKEKEQRAIKDLLDILRGKEFVHFIVRELGKNIIKIASDSFYYLTGERMSLRLADEKFNFYIDDHLTGIQRPVDTLSGGEIFLASFSLALALSRHIQTMKARSIHFFFIDEGFGTLDDETLSAVTGVMDRLRNEDVLVGFITHRKELKELVSAQIIVNKSVVEGSKLRVIV